MDFIVSDGIPTFNAIAPAVVSAAFHDYPLVPFLAFTCCFCCFLFTHCNC